MQTFFRLKSWLIHRLFEIDEYSIHSPFLFQFYVNCIKKAGQLPPLESIEKLRRIALTDPFEITVGKWGSCLKEGHPKVTVKEIARSGISRARFSLLFREIIRYFNFKSAAELGTSIGINTMYLAASHKGCLVHTFEGNPELCRYAEQNFHKAGMTNIRLIQGEIEEQLSSYINSGNIPEFIFFDANHRYDPTMKYFNMLNECRAGKSVFVFDDINWSREMHRAWNEIRQHPDVKIDLDLFQAGILIFGPDFPKLSARLTVTG